MESFVVLPVVFLSLCLIAHSFPGQPGAQTTESVIPAEAHSQTELQNPLVYTAVHEIRESKPFSSSSIIKYLLVEVHAAALAGFKAAKLDNIPPVIDAGIIGNILKVAAEIFGFKAPDLSKNNTDTKDNTVLTSTSLDKITPSNTGHETPSSTVATVSNGGEASVYNRTVDIFQNILKRFTEMVKLVFEQCKENAKKIKSEIYSVLFIKSLCALPDDRAKLIIEKFATQLTMKETCQMVTNMAADPALGIKLGGSGIVTLISKLNHGIITQALMDILVETICLTSSADYREMVLTDIKNALPDLGYTVCSKAGMLAKAAGKGILQASCGLVAFGWVKAVDFVKQKEKPTPKAVKEEVVGKLEASVRGVAGSLPQDMKVKRILDVLEILAAAESPDATGVPPQDPKSAETRTASSSKPTQNANTETDRIASVTGTEPSPEDESKTETMDSIAANIALLAITDAPEARRQILTEVTRLVGKEAVMNVIATLYAVDAAPILQTAPLPKFSDIVPVLASLNIAEMVSIATRVLSVYATAHVSAFPHLVADLPSGALEIMPAVTDKCFQYFAKKDKTRFLVLGEIIRSGPAKAALDIYDQCGPISERGSATTSTSSGTSE